VGRQAKFPVQSVPVSRVVQQRSFLGSAAKVPDRMMELKMKRPVFIARQSARPSGLVGKVIGSIMARETARLNDQAVNLLAPAPTDRVLEIGFGHGRTIGAPGEAGAIQPVQIRSG
jgi:hypothetical protein